jgi:hypothetical protein
MVAIANAAAAQKASDQQPCQPGSYGIHGAPPSLKGFWNTPMIVYRHSAGDLFSDSGDWETGKDAAEFRLEDLRSG